MYKIQVFLSFPKLRKDLVRCVKVARVPVKGDLVHIKVGCLGSVPPVEKVTLELNPRSGQPVASIEVGSDGAFDQVFYEDLLASGWKSAS